MAARVVKELKVKDIQRVKDKGSRNKGHSLALVRPRGTSDLRSTVVVCGVVRAPQSSLKLNLLASTVAQCVPSSRSALKHSSLGCAAVLFRDLVRRLAYKGKNLGVSVVYDTTGTCHGSGCLSGMP